MARTLILYIPVIHRGYIDFLSTHKVEIKDIYLIPETYTEELVNLKPDIASLPAAQVQKFLKSFGYENVFIFEDTKVSEFIGRPLLLVNDQISRAFAAKYFKDSDVQWESVFLRWDRDSIFSEEDPGVPETSDLADQHMMRQAQHVAEQSSDWWRQVGAVLVKDGVECVSAFNEAMPSDHTPYQRGAVRDFLKPGERPELVETIHAEQKIIASAARAGQSLEGATLYITHFPCPVCAKLIAQSGIKQCYFLQGSSSLRGKELLESAGVNIARVVL
jgi:dCMP deaminase